MNIDHPRKQIVPLAVGLSWQAGGIFQHKLDGKFALREVAGGVLAGEDVHGSFTAFDAVVWQGQDARTAPLIERLAMRNELCDGIIPIVPEVDCRGGEFLESILKAGGEGAVFKRLDSTYYDIILACKRIETFICRVGNFNGGVNSVGLFDAASGESRGNVPLRGGKCDRVRVGSLIKVEGFGLTANHKIREPRPCKDTPESWLIEF